MSRPTQTRAKLLAALYAAGSQGIRTRDLIQSLKDGGVQLKRKSFEVMLLREKSEGRIFGKGAYMPDTKGLVFRYFAQRDWCEAYVFEGAIDPAKRSEREKEKSKERWRRYRQAHRPQAIQRPGLTREERLKRDRERGKKYREKKRAERIAAGEKIRALSGMSERTIRRKERAAGKPPKVSRRGTARPGSEQVVRDDRVSAPVEVRKRELLTGPADYSKARITVVPTGIDYRYHVDPGSVERVFSALPVGRYLEEMEEA